MTISEKESIQVFNAARGIKQVKQTKYIIVMKYGIHRYYYQGGNYHWADKADFAVKYDFMTTAIGVASMDLNLAPLEYDIIPVTV